MDFNQFMQDPWSQGLLGAGAGMLQASGPQRFPVSTGQALSQGLLGLTTGYQTAIQHGLLADKIKQLKKEEENKKKLMEAIGTLPTIKDYGVPQFGEMGESYPQRTLQGGTGYLGGQLPLEGLLAQSAAVDPRTALSGLVDLEKSRVMASGKTGKGLYGGIQYAFDPKTNQYVPYSFDETTLQPVALGTPSGLQATVPMIPQVTQGGNIVSVPGRGVPGQMPITTPSGLKTQPSAEEVSKASMQGLGINMLDDLKKLSDEGKITVGPVKGRMIRASGMTGIKLTEDEGKALAQEGKLEVILLQAARGAQVGPKEQELYRQQLPRLDQPKALFDANVDLTKKNLEYLNEQATKQRAVLPITQTSPKMTWEDNQYMYRRLPDGTVQRKRK